MGPECSWYLTIPAASYLEEKAVSTLPPEDFRARLILTVLLVDLQLFFLTMKE